MTSITEIAPDVFRINTFIPEINLGFSQFLVRDEEPLLFHTGMRALYPLVSDAVAKLIEVSSLRWIGFSHFEADECGSLNEWLGAAPDAKPVCSFVGKVVSVDDFTSGHPSVGMADGEAFETGSKKFRFLSTPHVPHCWEAGMLFEQSTETLFCSDLFHQNSDVEPLTDKSVVDRAREALLDFDQGPLANYFPYTDKTDDQLAKLSSLRPQRIATMHGSVFEGNGEAEFAKYRQMLSEVLVGS